MRRVALTQIPVKDHQLTWVWKDSYDNNSSPSQSQDEIDRKWNIYKYLDFAKELENLWNMRLKLKPIVDGALGTFPKSSEDILVELEIIGRTETIQTTALLSFS